MLVAHLIKDEALDNAIEHMWKAINFESRRAGPTLGQNAVGAGETGNAETDTGKKSVKVVATQDKFTFEELYTYADIPDHGFAYLRNEFLKVRLGTPFLKVAESFLQVLVWDEFRKTCRPTFAFH